MILGVLSFSSIRVEVMRISLGVLRDQLENFKTLSLFMGFAFFEDRRRTEFWLRKRRKLY
jgi:hypothetical protein